jgi:hypothetical protein
VVLLDSVDVKEYSGKGFNGIRISSHHEVAETQIIIESNVACSDSGVETLLGNVQRLQSLESKITINIKIKIIAILARM